MTGLLASAVAQAATPTIGSQRILSKNGRCTMTVPADWKIGKWIKNSADAPDKSASAVVTSPSTGYNLAQAKPVVEETLTPVKIFENSSRRLWYRYKTDKGHGWYVGVPFNDGICGAQIFFDKAAQTDMAKKIALSVKAVR
ncbi:MAG: hypothetical protein WCB49_02355 [Gammaproteobacteria bacterium]